MCIPASRSGTASANARKLNAVIDAFPFWDSGFLGSRSLLRSKRLPAAQPNGIEADWARDGSVSLSDQIAGTIQSDRHNYGELYWGWQRLRR